MLVRYDIIRNFARQAAVYSLAAALWLPAGAARAACDFDMAFEAFAGGDPATADALFDDCVAAGEREAEAVFYRGILARNAGGLEAASRLLSRAVTLAPEQVAWRLEWAVTHEWLGDLDGALDIYAAALSQEPGNLPARLGIARMDHWQGRLRRSIAAYRDLLERHPGNAAVQSGLAFALMADNRVAESRALFEQILKDHPSDATSRDGLAMLADIRLHRVESSGGRVTDLRGRSASQYRMAYIATPSYALKWGIELTGQDAIVTPSHGNAIPINRAVRSAQSLFADYRFNNTTSALVSLRREELGSNENQARLHLEIMHKPADRHRVFAGVIPNWISGTRVNTLSYFGHVYQGDGDWSAMTQLYHGRDREFDDSLALSLAVTRSYGKRNWLRLGTSVSDTGGKRSEALSLGLLHHFRREFAVKANLVTSFSTNEHEINLGFIYEY